MPCCCLELPLACAWHCQGDDGQHPDAVPAVGPDAPPGPGAPPPKDVQPSNLNVERKADAKSSLHTVLQAIASRPHMSLHNGPAALADAIEPEHGLTLVMHKTSSGCLQWAQGMASAKRLDVLAGLWDKLLSKEFAMMLGQA